MFSERAGRTLSYTHCHAIIQLPDDNHGINKHSTETEKGRKKIPTYIRVTLLKVFPL